MHDNFSASDGAVILFLASVLLYHMFVKKKKSQKIKNLQSTVESDRRTILQNELRERTTLLQNILTILIGVMIPTIFIVLWTLYSSK